MLGFVFLVLPIFDMLTGFLVVREIIPEGFVGSPSQIGRLLATLILLIANRRKKISVIWIGLFYFLILLETIVGMQHNKIGGVLFGYVTCSKFLYMFLLFLTLKNYFQSHGTVVVNYLKYNLNLINFSIFFAFATGLANSTYGSGFGTKGFFSSGNSLGIYIGATTLLLMGMKRYKYFDNVSPTTYFFAVISLLFVGTKTSLILAITIVAVFLWMARWRVFVIPIFAALTAIFWELLISKIAIFFDIIIIRYSNKNSLAAYFFSNRENYILNAFEEIFSQDISSFRWLFGAGSYVSFQNPYTVLSFDGLETDVFDILFMYGFLGLFVYFLLVWFGIRLHLKKPFLLLGISLIYLHSALAGHVLFNGMSSTLLVAYLAVGWWIKTETEGKSNNSQNNYGAPT